MQGSLKDMTVIDLIQHNCIEQKTAWLMLTHNGQTAEIYFHSGNITHAVYGDLAGEEAIYKIIDWEDGEFLLEAGVTSTQQTVTHKWSAILLEGARRLDEQSQEIDQVNYLENERNFDPMAQRLEDALKDMSSEIPGFIACAVVGMDALNIAAYSKDKVDIELVSAQMTLLFKLVDTSVSKIDPTSVIEDNLLTTKNSYVLMRYIPGKKYYLGIIVDRKTSLLGNIRLITKIYADRISKLIPH